jgi:hypothetical protein
VGVAVNVTEVPEQMVDEEAEITTEGTAAELTDMVTEFDVAVAGLAQVAVEVITQVITSEFANVPLV